MTQGTLEPTASLLTKSKLYLQIYSRKKWEEKVLDREEGRAEGRAEGQAEGRASEIYIIRNQIKQVHRTPEETAELLVLEPEYIKKVAELLEEHPEETDVQIAARILKAGVCE